MTCRIRQFAIDDCLPDHRMNVNIWYEGTVLDGAVHVTNPPEHVEDEGHEWFRTRAGTFICLSSIDLEFDDDGGNMIKVPA